MFDDSVTMILAEIACMVHPECPQAPPARAEQNGHTPFVPRYAIIGGMDAISEGVTTVVVSDRVPVLTVFWELFCPLSLLDSRMVSGERQIHVRQIR